jgi:hypothetical protein
MLEVNKANSCCDFLRIVLAGRVACLIYAAVFIVLGSRLLAVILPFACQFAWAAAVEGRVLVPEISENTRKGLTTLFVALPACVQVARGKERVSVRLLAIACLCFFVLFNPTFLFVGAYSAYELSLLLHGALNPEEKEKNRDQ